MWYVMEAQWKGAQPTMLRRRKEQGRGRGFKFPGEEKLEMDLQE